MSAQHTKKPPGTPGPWVSCNNGRIAQANTLGAKDVVYVADVCDSPRMFADADLIAAAPDLLAALIAFRDGGPQGGQDFEGWHASYDDAVANARTAIAKATGSEA